MTDKSSAEYRKARRRKWYKNRKIKEQEKNSDFEFMMKLIRFNNLRLRGGLEYSKELVKGC